MEYSPEVVNQMFIGNLRSTEGLSKTAEDLQGYVRDRLRDVQFSKKVLPPRAVTPTDRGVQRSVNHDGLVYIDEIEPNSGAVAIAWTGSPRVQYLKAKRYEIPFFQVSSFEYETTEQELWASVNPIHKIVENNTVKDLGTLEDLRFLILVEQALAVTGSVIKGTATNAGAASGDIELGDIVTLKNTLAGERRPDDILVINAQDYNKLVKWQANDVGYSVKEKMVYGTYLPDAILQLRVVKVVDTVLLKQGNIYLFSRPEFVGRFMTLGTTQFSLKKERDLISWSSWEFIAMSIANAYSVAKLEIYSGASQALPTAEEIFTSKIGVPPTTYPTVVQY